jgi:hypothetical protein
VSPRAWLCTLPERVGSVRVMVSSHAARHLARQEMAAALPRRWRHVQAVAAQAERLASLPDMSGELLVAAAWLHDIGYAPGLVVTGFHPLDGARYLRERGADDRLACLVAHHSCAVHEARVRGLDGALLAEFKREGSPTYDALVFCDLTTGPDGEPLTYQGRMDEIQQRYGPDHEVTRAVELARYDLAGCCERTIARTAAAQVSLYKERYGLPDSGQCASVSTGGYCS